jgi:hypothetical protein
MVYMSSPPKLLSRNWAWWRRERHELKGVGAVALKR